MLGRCCVDTTTILYAASDAPPEADKHRRALTLLDGTDSCNSVHLLQKPFVDAIRKGRGSATADRARLWIDRLSLHSVVPTDLAPVEAAIRGAGRHQTSHWDAAIIAAAESVGASALHTDDLSHGQRYGSVLVQNPFRDP